MGKSAARPNNGPSTTGKPSGGGRGNNPPSLPKGKQKDFYFYFYYNKQDFSSLLIPF